MLCEPAERVEVLICALPAVNVALPREVLPSKKVTVPVGVPAKAGLRWR